MIFKYPIEIIKKDDRLVAFAESPSKDECVYLELSSDLNVNEGDKFSIFNIDTDLREITEVFYLITNALSVCSSVETVFYYE